MLRNGWNLVAFPGSTPTLRLTVDGQVRNDRAYWVFASGNGAAELDFRRHP